MTTDEHNTYLEWLYLESDDQLTPGEQGRLREHLNSCGSCGNERESIATMNRLIGASRLPVREGFRAAVMTALQPAGWEAKSPRTWVAAGIILFLFGIGAALLTGWGAMDEVSALGPIAAASAALLDLFKSSVLAGAGLFHLDGKEVLRYNSNP